MRLFCRVTVLGLLVFLCRPAGVDASSITSVVGAASDFVEADCSFVGATEGCRTFTFAQPIDPGTLSISGTFQFDNDIALFAFSVSSDVLFTATTSSYGNQIGGFDPVLGLYRAGALLPYTPAGAPRTCEAGFACVDDIDFSDNFDAQIANLLLTSGDYLLALTQTGNSPHKQLGFDQAAANLACYFSGLPDAECTAGAPGMFGGLSGNFELELQVDLATPVPEPGTLSLLALGSACAGLARRRRMRRQAG